MGRHMRKCKDSRESVVELESTSQIGARMTPTSTAQKVQVKKRKFGLGESEMKASLVRLKTRLLPVIAAGNSDFLVCSEDSTCDSSGSDHVSASCCSRNGSSQLAEESTNFVDLKEESGEFFAVSGGDLEERRETTPSSDGQAELGELESIALPGESYSRRRSMSVQRMPSEVELEEFFSAAETKLHKQFMDKYNYDILKDEPLEGRYEWACIPVKP